MPGSELGLQLGRAQRAALAVGVSVLATCIVGGWGQPLQFFRSYLFGFLLWWGIAVGCLAILMLHHLVSGGWGMVIRRMLEAGTRTLPLVALMFLPLAFVLPELYPWADPEAAADELLRHKEPYLNVPFFLVRAGIYFAAWLALAWLLNKWSAEQDRTRDADLPRKFRLIGAPGLAVYGLTVTFASVDWVMSLEPHWFSTIYGVLFIVGQALATLAFVIPLLMLCARHRPLSGVVTPGHYHDLGNLLLAFTMLWAYVSFSQFLIIWSGNIAEETPWYIHRLGHGWQIVALVLVVFHFAVPFVLLLLRRTKRSAQALAAVAAGIFLMRVVDLFWLVAPNFYAEHFYVNWMDVAVPVGLGGLWFWMFLQGLKSRPLLALDDLPEGASFAAAEPRGVEG